MWHAAWCMTEQKYVNEFFPSLLFFTSMNKGACYVENCTYAVNDLNQIFIQKFIVMWLIYDFFLFKSR